MNRAQTIEKADQLEQEAFDAWKEGVRLADYAMLRKLIGYIRFAPDERVEGLIYCVRDKIEFLITELKDQKESTKKR
jgi:hypothetical protein